MVLKSVLEIIIQIIYDLIERKENIEYDNGNYCRVILD
jgi:hypothetical protein